jgi:hypothetical protein
MSNKINKVASHLLEKFEVKTRSHGDNFIICHCKSHLQDFIQEVHAGIFPDEFIYQVIYICIKSVANDNQSLCAVLDGVRPDNNIYSLTEWSISTPSRIYSINNILSEYEGNNYSELLQLAQLREIKSICEQTICYLKMLSNSPIAVP